jgi:hypothetical protein
MPRYFYYDDSHPERPFTRMVYTNGKIALPPGTFTELVPETPGPGQVNCFVDGAWVLKEDHRGEYGFLDGVSFMVNEIGPYPEGFTLQRPDEDQTEEWERLRKEDLLRKLEEVDQKAIRPLREIAIAASSEDVEYSEGKLAELEAEAASLRAALAETPEWNSAEPPPEEPSGQGGGEPSSPSGTLQ